MYNFSYCTCLVDACQVVVLNILHVTSLHHDVLDIEKQFNPIATQPAQHVEPTI